MSVFKDASRIGLWTILSRIGGFFREIVTAYFLGASFVVDALVLAMKIPSFFRRITAEGAVNACFVPLFTKLIAEKNKKEALRFASSLISLSLTFLFLVTALFVFFAPQLLALLFPGLVATPARFDATVLYARIIFPFVILISATAIYGGVLNAQKRFSAFASSPFFGNMFIVGCVLFFAHTNKNAFSLKKAGMVFAWAVLISGGVQLFIVMWDTWRSGAFFLPKWPKKNPLITSFFKKLGPVILGSGLVQINLLIGLFIASWLPKGSISHLNYADKLVQLPLSVVGTAISIALLPSLSRSLGKKDYAQANKDQEMSMKVTFIIASTLMLILCLLAHPLVFLAFGRGKFQTHDILATSKALMAFAPGLPSYIFIKILSTRFFAQGNTSTPLVAGMLGLIVDIVASVTLMLFFGHVGIAAAASLSGWTNAAVLMFLLYKKNLWHIPASLKHFFLRSTLLLLTLGVIFFLLFAQTSFLYAQHVGIALIACASFSFGFIGCVLLGFRLALPKDFSSCMQIFKTSEGALKKANL